MNHKADKRLYVGPAFDMHCHLLPGLDDGPESFDESLRMLQIAAGEGTEAIVATPHLVCDGSERIYAARARESVERLRELAEQAGIHTRLLLGFEVLLSPLVLHTSDIGILATEGSGGMLVELGPGDPRETLDELVYEAGHFGISLILAHPERSRWLGAHRAYIDTLAEGGVALQVNAGSIIGAWGKDAARFARRLAGDGRIRYIGSDAHSATARGPHLREALSILQGWVGEEAAHKIAHGNAEELFARAPRASGQ